MTGGRDAASGVIPGRYALSVGMPDLPAAKGFRWVMLSELARLESGHTPRRSEPEYWDGDIPWIGIRDATANHGLTIGTTLQTITEAGLANSSARLLPAGTVCLSRTASVGYVVTMGVPMATSQDFVNWVCGPQLSGRYLHYLLMLEQESIRRFSYGTTHQTMYYPEAKALHVCVPSREEQGEIVEVLGALDDKIAANRKLEATTRKLATALFSFASQDGVGSSVDELADFHNRRRVPLSASQRESMKGDVPYYGATGQFGTVDRAIFDEILVLVGEDGSVINDDESPVTQYVWGPAWVNNHAHVLTGRTCSSEVLLLALQQANVTPLVTGAVQAKISMGNLKKLTLTVPKESSMSGLDLKIQPMFALLRKSADETRSLTALRDTLLPRLMSGELRVRDAEREVEAVL